MPTPPPPNVERLALMVEYLLDLPRPDLSAALRALLLPGEPDASATLARLGLPDLHAAGAPPATVPYLDAVRGVWDATEHAPDRIALRTTRVPLPLGVEVSADSLRAAGRMYDATRAASLLAYGSDPAPSCWDRDAVVGRAREGLQRGELRAFALQRALLQDGIWPGTWALSWLDDLIASEDGASEGELALAARVWTWGARVPLVEVDALARDLGISAERLHKLLWERLFMPTVEFVVRVSDLSVCAS